MRNIFYFLIVILLSGCYKDKGNYDYSKLQDMEITLPFAAYEVGVGMNLKIDPVVVSELPESDFNWNWEVSGFPAGGGYETFYKFAEGRSLDHNFNLSSLMPSTANYNVRVHAIQKSNGRSFYSTIFTIRITSPYTGLMVLHGSDASSDIALLQATDFRITAGTMETKLIPNLYSSQNNNERIAGKGISVVQCVTEFMSNINRAYVVAITSNTGVWAKYSNFGKGGDWNSLFMPGINDGVPEILAPQGQNVFAVDKGKMFQRGNSYDIFPVPFSGLDQFYAVTPILTTGSNSVQRFFFDKTSRGFVTFSGSDNPAQITTSRFFNLANMNANLVHTDRGGRTGHFMAVMKEDNGNKFLAEIDWTASSDANLPYAKYDMQVLPDINDAKFHAFGDNQITMCYYATNSKVYRYTARDGDPLTGVGASNQLRLMDGSPIVFDGDITMMKILKPLRNTSGSLAVNYYNYNKIMLVGVYKNNQGTLYSLKIDESTGDVISYTTFSGFEKIFDANIKGL